MSQREIDRGARVENLLKDPDLDEAFKNVRQAIFERIEQTPLRDVEGLKDWRRQLKLLRDVRANLEQAVRDGKLAAEELRVEKERRVRLFR